MNKSTISVAAVTLIIGLALGTILFPRNTTLTSTQITTVTTSHLVTQNITVITSGTKSYAIVTFTQIGVESYYKLVACTTVSGGARTTYTEEFGGPTSVTTLYPPNLPPEFIVTIVTASYFTEAETTEYSTASC